MATPGLRPTGQAAVETQLLAQLGLPASASPEDVDQQHQAVSEFLAAAPPGIRGWARAQVASLDTAYIHLTDPVGLGGSALMSPASPPTVVPGGPATPPARRGPAAAAAPVEPIADEAEALAITGEPTAEDLAALYAMVTPSVHDDMKPQARQVVAPSGVAAPAGAAPGAMPAGAGSNIWKRIVIGAVGIAAVVGIAFGVNQAVNVVGGGEAPAPSQVAQTGGTAPTVDLAKVGELMARLQADPEDVDALLDLGSEYYNGGDFETAGSWFDKVLAIDARNVEALLARGAVYFNLVDFANAETTWMKVAAIDPDNLELHYDLGFLYLNESPPDWAGVQEEWGKVIELDPTSELATIVNSHLESLAGSSMFPGSSGGASPAPGASAAPSAGPSSPASPASPAPSAVP